MKGKYIGQRVRVQAYWHEGCEFGPHLILFHKHMELPPAADGKNTRIKIGKHID